MEIIEQQGTITQETYLAVSVEIAGLNCVFRMPEWQYSQLKEELHDDAETLKKAITNAFKKNK